MTKHATDTGAQHPDRARPTKKSGEDRELDDALDATFPASDPVTVGDVTGDEPIHTETDRQTPPLDTNLVKKLARELKETTKKD